MTRLPANDGASAAIDAKAADTARTALIRRTAPAALALAAIWSYWPSLAQLARMWLAYEEYSVGFLVGPFVAWMAWRDRFGLRAAAAAGRPNWIGLMLLAASQALRPASLYFALSSLDRLSLLLAAAGGVLLLGGWPLVRRARWLILFLALATPPPARLHDAVSLPLQRITTSAAVGLLELCGYYVVREGNVLHLDGAPEVAVTEACGGLRMLTAFVFVTGATAFMVRRPVWQKLGLIASSLPIATACNALRIAATAAYAGSGREPAWVNGFHDAAGILMMPLAVAMSLAVLWLLGLIGAEGGGDGRAAVSGSGASHAAASSSGASAEAVSRRSAAGRQGR